MKKEFKVKIDGKERNLFLSTPSHGASIKIDLHYRKMFADGVRAGLLTSAEARKRAGEAEVWTEKDSEDSFDVVQRIGILETIIENDKGSASEQEMEDAILALEKLRTKALEFVAKRNEVLDNTAEGFAEEQKIHKFIEMCLKDTASGESLFSNVSEYEKFLNENPDSGSEIVKQAYFFEYGSPDEIGEKWAEVKYRKAQAEKIMKEHEEKEAEKEKIKKSAKKKVSKKKISKK